MPAWRMYLEKQSQKLTQARVIDSHRGDRVKVQGKNLPPVGTFHCSVAVFAVSIVRWTLHRSVV